MSRISSTVLATSIVQAAQMLLVAVKVATASTCLHVLMENAPGVYDQGLTCHTVGSAECNDLSGDVVLVRGPL